MVRLAPAFVDGWLNLGVALYRHGDVNEARRASDLAVMADPNHPAALINHAMFLRLAGDLDAADAVLRRIVDTGVIEAAAGADQPG